MSGLLPPPFLPCPPTPLWASPGRVAGRSIYSAAAWEQSLRALRIGRGGVVAAELSLSFRASPGKAAREGECPFSMSLHQPAQKNIKTIATENWRVHSWPAVFAGLCGSSCRAPAANQSEAAQSSGSPRGLVASHYLQLLPSASAPSQHGEFRLSPNSSPIL